MLTALCFVLSVEDALYMCTCYTVMPAYLKVLLRVSRTWTPSARRASPRCVSPPFPAAWKPPWLPASCGCCSRCRPLPPPPGPFASVWASCCPQSAPLWWYPRWWLCKMMAMVRKGERREERGERREKRVVVVGAAAAPASVTHILSAPASVTHILSLTLFPCHHSAPR